MFFFTYLRRELRRRMRQALVIALGLALGIGLVITVTAMSSGVSAAQGKILGSLYGVGTDITVTTPVKPLSGGGGFRNITPKPYARHQDTLQSTTQGPINSSDLAAISRLHDVARASGGLVLTEIKVTLPGTNAPSASFRPPIQISVTGAQIGGRALGPLSVARLSSGRGFTAADASADVALLDSGYAAAHKLKADSEITVAGTRFKVIGIVRQPGGSSPPDIYIPLARAQDLAPRMHAMVNIVYVQAASASFVGTVSSEISRLMPSATVSTSGDLAKGVSGSLASTSRLARTFGTWLAVLALLAALAVASLLTLAAVARRVREFGTLKALGWRSGRISVQVLGESLAMGIAGAALGIALGLGGALLASAVAPHLTATVSTTNIGKNSFGPAGTNGGIFNGTVGGPVQTFANPNATHAVAVPFSAPITFGAIVLAVILAIAGALIAGLLGGWQITRLRPAAALARVE
jgi:putative ABC transport system permease protein